MNTRTHFKLTENEKKNTNRGVHLLNVLLFLSLFGQYTQTDRHTHTDPAISLTAALPLSSKKRVARVYHHCPRNHCRFGGRDHYGLPETKKRSTAIRVFPT